MANDELRREIGFLGSVLGDTIREFAGDESFTVVESLRRAAWDRRVGRQQADQRMKELIAGLDDAQISIVIRAFSIFLDLANLVEDRRRVQVLSERAKQAYPNPRGESIRAAIAQLKSDGKSSEEVQALVDQLHIDLVFTAHPTDAKRRSVRSKLRAIRRLLQDHDSDQLPEARDETERAIRGEVAKLWQTDFIRPWRPSVMQEVARGLSIKPVLWKEVPRISAELGQALQESYGDSVQLKRASVTFGSWIGGDRDGHPGVTADVTEETFTWLRREAVAFHLATCDELFESLSLSTRQIDLDSGVSSAIDSAVDKWPHLQDRLASLPPNELVRRWLSIIRWKLELLQQDSSSDEYPDAIYQSACDLAADVDILHSALISLPCGSVVSHDLETWKTQIESFGLHLAKLDVRQGAEIYAGVVNELLRVTGWSGQASDLDESQRVAALTGTLGRAMEIDEEKLSPMTQETLALFRTLHTVARGNSTAAIGTHVISMTSAPSDVLTVLWLWELTQADLPDDVECLAIAPLLETIDDLKAGPEILAGMLSIPAYRQLLECKGKHQMIMLGYSDSTKDGGYLSACWSLHEAQQSLVDVANEHDVNLTFFHGRGGSLGRGGGPAARSILSLPRGTFHGSLRLTEQGEVLADRYDDPAIAHRHMEQLVWSSLLAASVTQQTVLQQWHERMEKLAEASLKKYRELLEQPAFVEFFRSVTPISEIEQLPIGSRPSRRKPGGGLSDLRAIPWVFSWTQVRCLLPAWYGIGTAIVQSLEEDNSLDELLKMYAEWPFFRALIDNAELGLAKSDLAIAGEYATLAADREPLDRLSALISNEFHESLRAVLALTKQEELLDGTPWLKESIRVRNRFIDPLNLIQVELLRRGQALDESEKSIELRHLTRLSINGIAAGMRTSG